MENEDHRSSKCNLSVNNMLILSTNSWKGGSFAALGSFLIIKLNKTSNRATGHEKKNSHISDADSDSDHKLQTQLGQRKRKL